MNEQLRRSKAMLDQLFQEWDDRSSQYGAVAYYAALAQNAEAWKSIFTLFVPLLKGTDHIGRRLDYGSVIFASGTLTMERAKSILSCIIDEGMLALPDLPEATLHASMSEHSAQHWGSQHCRYNLPFPLNEYHFSVVDGDAAEIPRGSLCARDLPLYPHPYAAIEHLFGIRCVNQGARNAELAALTPEYRVKVAQVRIAASTLTVTIQRLKELAIIGKVHVESASGALQCEDLAFNHDAATVPTTGYPRRIMITLLSCDHDEIIEEWHYDAWHHDATYPAPKGPVFEVTETGIEDLILGGESETVEFKRSLPNPEDAARAVTAFANTHGGRLILGVEDNGEIVGCEVAKLKDRITSILHGHCDPIPRFDVATATLEERAIGIIIIPEGADKPYTTKRGTYIRSGATTRHAMRRDIEGMYTARRERTAR